MESNQEYSMVQTDPTKADPSDDAIKMSKSLDGRWGWVVTLSSFMLNFLVDGVCYTVGVFFPVFLKHFGGSKAKTMLLSSVINGLSFLFGPVAGASVNRFDCRKVTIVGIIIASGGLFLSTFSPNLDVMILLYSVVGGIGFGLVYTPTIIIVSYYFEKRRALATGIATCGSGIGGFVFAPLSVLLLETYGWRGSLWIITGIVLNGIVFASFYRSDYPPKVKDDNKTKSNDEMTMKTMCSSIGKTFDCSILTSPSFIVYSLSCFLVSVGFFVPFNCLPALASDLGISAVQGALLISIIGICNTVSNVVSGFIIDLPCVDNILANNIVIVTGGVATIFVPYCRTFGLLAVYSVVFGVMIGAFEVLNSIIMVELKGIERLSNGFGLLNMFIGFASIVGSPIAGSLSDVTGNYDVAFYFAGGVITVAGIICFPLRRIVTWESERHSKQRKFKESVPAADT
ncbi:monocarboxylate transporter 12-like [Mizuhopecten yessoensis]|uniref:Monocarboxylate transporter 12 n=1 Tax=Mizuhopecten yessoensis TaxID=6573 RepID=A0A210PG75_MIZYE|nr:monocarboxylate transporter 12-like [Mizuhopecten yessoensis]OWF35485.1 Monocarboxylate transporter 12 [Mizuhopecten yessoensis]